MEVTKVVVVGAGSSSSTPRLACVLGRRPCRQCQDALIPGSRNARLNPSLLIQAVIPASTTSEGEQTEATTINILIDCGKTFREAALKVLAPLGVAHLNAVLLTHGHADAIFGLDDLREFTDKTACQVFGDEATLAQCRLTFNYLFAAKKAGIWTASIDWQQFEPGATICAAGLPIISLPVFHGKNYICNAYAFHTSVGPIAYLSDVSDIPDETLKTIRGLGQLRVLILDLLAMEPYPSHFSWNESIECARELNADFTYFVGMSHSLDYHECNRLLRTELPGRAAVLAYDGAVVFDAAREASRGDPSASA